jgi:NAD+ kinase
MSDPRVVLVGGGDSAAATAEAAGLCVAATLAVDDFSEDTTATGVSEDTTATDVSADTVDASAEIDAVVTVGERALIEVGATAPAVPVLAAGDLGERANAVGPTDTAGQTEPAGPTDTAEQTEPAEPTDTAEQTPVDLSESALAALAADEVRTVEHRLLTVDIGTERVGRVVFDAGLVTSEQARISEYSVYDGERHVVTVRSDGVVVSTPLGSDGYGRAAGGPVLAPDTGLAVTAIAPFATNANSHVLAGPVRLRVERDDRSVSLLLDDERTRHVPPGVPVVLEPAATLRLFRPEL